MGTCYLQDVAAKIHSNMGNVTYFDSTAHLECDSDVFATTQGQSFLKAQIQDSLVDPELRQVLDKCQSKIVVTAGNVGKDAQGNVMVFGRNGADVSLASLAGKLGVKFVEFYTARNGLFTCHIPANSPFPSARILKRLNYSEAQEIAATNVHVLHPQSIKMLEYVQYYC